MDLGKKCISQDSRYENGKGYYSGMFPGMVFQRDNTSDAISKIRLTKDFKGKLPDGTPVDLKNLKLKDLVSIYPNLEKTWGSRACSDYWRFSNDTLSFYVKIDTTQKPVFPIDEAYYSVKPIEAIDLLVSCYKIFEKKKPYKQFLEEPVLFVDSVNTTTLEMIEFGYQLSDFALVKAYGDSSAINLIGEQGKFGVVYFETKTFAKNKYWNYFRSKSTSYSSAVPTPESDSSVIYILNDSILRTSMEADLSSINDQAFIDLYVIDQKELQKKYNILDKSFGVIIRTKSTIQSPKEKR